MADSVSVFQLLKRPTIAEQQIAQSPYAILSLQLDNRRPIFMNLGYLEDTRQYWYTRDLIGFAFEQGRLVETYRLASGIDLSGLRQAEIYQSFGFWSLRPQQTQRFSMRFDLPEQRLFGLVAHVVLQAGDVETKEVAGQQRQVLSVTEQWTVADLNFSTENWYWLDVTAQQVMASRQHLAPSLPVIEYYVVKPWW